MRTYVENNLIQGEKIEYETTYHWMIFISLRTILTLLIELLIKHWTDDFVIINKRAIIKTGLIRRNTFELNLSKIESVYVSGYFMQNNWLWKYSDGWNWWEQGNIAFRFPLIILFK